MFHSLSAQRQGGDVLVIVPFLFCKGMGKIMSFLLYVVNIWNFYNVKGQSHPFWRVMTLMWFPTSSSEEKWYHWVMRHLPVVVGKVDENSMNCFLVICTCVHVCIHPNISNIYIYICISLPQRNQPCDPGQEIQNTKTTQAID
jgi:hypothetical protein